MSDKMMLTLQDLQVLAATAERNGTSRNFPEVALQWAAGAQAEIERLRAELDEAVTALPQAVRNERERWATICRGVMAEHGGDPAGQLVAYGNRDRLLAQCQAAGASQVLIRGLGA